MFQTRDKKASVPTSPCRTPPGLVLWWWFVRYWIKKKFLVGRCFCNSRLLFCSRVKFQYCYNNFFFPSDSLFCCILPPCGSGKRNQCSKYWCFSWCSETCSVHSVVTSVDSCEEDMSSHLFFNAISALYSTIMFPHDAAINFANKLAGKSVRVCAQLSALCCAPSQHYPTVFLIWPFFISVHPLSLCFNHPQASQETLWGSFDWNDIAASSILKWEKTSNLLLNPQ